ncbi:MAG: hypothetical protein OEV92_01295 [Nitrospinota bacterium]|nr:hypothetical protein [Nitrospinota bacterium]
MSHTEVCPVCEGAGIVNRERLGGAVVEFNISCYGCMGKGWVVAPGDKSSAVQPGAPSENAGVDSVTTLTRVVKSVGRKK